MFIVLFDDGMGLTVPYGWDPDCEGAICCFSDAVAVFETRADARKAIRISTAFARLRKEQGAPVNTDFTESRANIQIVPLQAKGA